ncbi:hypothetical protein LCGC14_1987180 [marine sediment metagenome]|uniref:Uncharacterized protein n=1 Tax=marine sediment metagenome TaxID=412755 RepID=A0A0F9HKH0_9ZZZZ
MKITKLKDPTLYDLFDLLGIGCEDGRTTVQVESILRDKDGGFLVGIHQEDERETITALTFDERLLDLVDSRSAENIRRRLGEQD